MTRGTCLGSKPNVYTEAPGQQSQMKILVLVGEHI